MSKPAAFLAVHGKSISRTLLLKTAVTISRACLRGRAGVHKSAATTNSRHPACWKP